MATSTCAFCGKSAHLTLVAGHRIRDESDVNRDLLEAAYRCDNCSRYSVAAVSARRSDLPTSMDKPDIDHYIVKGRQVQWHPRTGQSPDIRDVPEHIGAAAREAYSSASIGADMAAILMARTVIEATAKDKGILSGPLVAKIDTMKDRNLIRPAIAEVAHEIRHFGNDMAHGDIRDRPTAEDAADVLSLMAQVLSEVFQGPALLDAVRARRTGKGSKDPAAKEPPPLPV